MRRGAGISVLVTTALALATAGASAAAAAGLVVTDLNSGSTPATLANALVGSGVSISNVAYTGSNRAAGSFTGDSAIVGFGGGIVLDSGNAQTGPNDPPCTGGVEGPNTCYEPSGSRPGGPAGSANSTDFSLPGDTDLSTLAGFPTSDASVLQFDFVPQGATIQFSYAFGSEEYSEFSNAPFNDVFGLFVNGGNCALVPGIGATVSVDNINDGNDAGGDATPHNPQFFRDNVNPSPSINTQLDGLTTVLTCSAPVNPGQVNHMKLAVADASDGVLDSAVFIQAGTFTSPPDTGATGAPPPPVAGKSVVLRVVKDPVYILYPPGKAPAGAARAAAIQPGPAPGFVPLKGAVNVPIGSHVDTEEGQVALTSAANLSGRTQTAQFHAGIFQVLQKRASKPTTDLVLSSSSFASFAKTCGTKGSGARASAARSKKRVGRLFGSGKGRFRTRGSFSAATVRGTIWLTEDRCDGTLTHVTKGSVAVFDFAKNKRVTVKSGHSYLARATRAAIKKLGKT